LPRSTEPEFFFTEDQFETLGQVIAMEREREQEDREKALAPLKRLVSGRGDEGRRDHRPTSQLLEAYRCGITDAEYPPDVAAYAKGVCGSSRRSGCSER
jgi:hypothetical protein